MRPCGPVVDADAEQRTRQALGTRVPEQAWPVLAPIAAASPYLAGLMRRDPASLRTTLEASPEARLDALCLDAASARGEGAGRVLRRLKGETHLLIALADLGGAWDLEQVTGAMTRFADAALQAALAVAVQAEADRGRLLLTPDTAKGRLPGVFVLAMGKHGAGELNYSSDIDISFFFDPALLPAAPGVDPGAAANRIAQAASALLNERTADGYVFRTDLRLRPDPAATPPAVSTAAALSYYEVVGQNWERAAFIKARVAAGDVGLGESFLRELQPFIWRRSLDYAAIADIHSIKRQILAGEAEGRIQVPGADLKRGRGGIREIEFYVQTQQLILGGRDPGLRSSRTLDALAALTTAGHVAPETCGQLSESYRRLRAWEHRVQMISDEQTHRLPAPPDERLRVAALSGFDDVRRFDKAVQRTLQGVDRRYAELFAEEEPLSSRFGSLVFTGVENDPETLATLDRMGFTDPVVVSETIRSWHHGRIRATRTPRGRELFTRLAPRLLEAAGRTGAPDTAFARFAAFFSNLSAGVQVQSLFLAEPAVFEQLVEVLAFAPDMARALSRRPAALDALLDARFREPIDMAGAGEPLSAAVAGTQGLEPAMAAARRVAGEQSFRIGLQLLTGAADPLLAGAAYTDLADAALTALAPRALAEVERRAGAFPGSVAVLALGSAGSREMTARSDLDLMVLYDAEPGALSLDQGWRAETVYDRFAQRLVSALSSPTAEGTLYAVDMRLRPFGEDGPLAVSLPTFAAYYGAEAETWERMALTRARVVWADPPDFADQAAAAIERALGQGGDPARLAEDVRAMRSLLAQAHPPSGDWDLKHAPGGLVDIEFAAQCLRLAHADAVGPFGTGVEAVLLRTAELRLASRAVLAPLLRAWRLQHALTQLLKAALDEGANPSREPTPFGRKLARAGGARTPSSLHAKLAGAQAAAHRSHLSVLRSTERPSRRVQSGKGPSNGVPPC